MKSDCDLDLRASDRVLAPDTLSCQDDHFQIPTCRTKLQPRQNSDNTHTYTCLTHKDRLLYTLCHFMARGHNKFSYLLESCHNCLPIRLSQKYTDPYIYPSSQPDITFHSSICTQVILWGWFARVCAGFGCLRSYIRNLK